MNSIFEQLAGALTHLGEKQIITLHLGSFQLQFDKVAMIMSWIVMALLLALALFLRRALKQGVEDTPTACKRHWMR